MPVVLRNQQSAVVDALRASRNADDELSRIKENSLEEQRNQLLKLVESANWRYGPADLIATFPHHLLCKSPAGELVQVEWHREQGGVYNLGRSVVHEMSVPVADLGAELMETARSAVDQILSEQPEAAEPMLRTIAEALDAGGSLQRRVVNEITLRSLARDAWWHHVVGERDDIVDRMPSPIIEGDDAIDRSINEMLIFLREEASVASKSLRSLESYDIAKDIDTLAHDIAEDIGRAVSALASVESSKNHEEAVKTYEAVVSVAPRLLNGIEFLKELTDTAQTTEA